MNDYQLMESIMQGNYETNQLIELLKKFQKKHPSPETMNNFLQAIQDSAEYTIQTKNFDKPIVDLAGTGGDEKNMINLSTLSALTCAATGLVNVAKYGNRSATSLCGSMDILEKIGLNIDLNKKQIKQQLKNTHFAPLFARTVYPGGKFVGPARSAVQGATIFNILFPLARPIQGDLKFVFGLAKKNLFTQIENIYQKQKNIRCILVHGLDDTDEISVTGQGKTQYSLIENGKITKGILDCQKIFNIKPVDLSLLQISDKNESLKLFLDTLNPKIKNKKVSAIRNAIIANAAIALFIALDKNNLNLHDAAKYIPIIKSALASGKILPNPFTQLFTKKKPVIIAEIKPKSPSEGILYKKSLPNLAKIYEANGADAISVLTEPKRFGGSMELLKKIRKTTSLPILRKDFITSKIQITEAAQAQANAILLIVSILTPTKLKQFIQYANDLNLVPLVEIFDQNELKIALEAGSQFIGVNARNLKTLEMNQKKALQTLKLIPKHIKTLLFSGIKTNQDLKNALAAGAQGVLIGTSLLKAKNPGDKLKEIICN